MARSGPSAHATVSRTGDCKDRARPKLLRREPWASNAKSNFGQGLERNLSSLRVWVPSVSLMRERPRETTLTMSVVFLQPQHRLHDIGYLCSLVRAAKRGTTGWLLLDIRRERGVREMHRRLDNPGFALVCSCSSLYNVQEVNSPRFNWKSGGTQYLDVAAQFRMPHHWDRRPHTSPPAKQTCL